VGGWRAGKAVDDSRFVSPAIASEAPKPSGGRAPPKQAKGRPAVGKEIVMSSSSTRLPTLA
jgi:hypothetical protein